MISITVLSRSDMQLKCKTADENDTELQWCVCTQETVCPPVACDHYHQGHQWQLADSSVRGHSARHDCSFLSLADTTRHKSAWHIVTLITTTLHCQYMSVYHSYHMTKSEHMHTSHTWSSWPPHYFLTDVPNSWQLLLSMRSDLNVFTLLATILWHQYS